MSKLTAYLLLLCIASSVTTTCAEPDSLANLPFVKRVKMVSRFYSYDAAAGDSLSMVQYINSVKKVAIKANDKSLITEADLMRAYFYYLRGRQRPPGYTEYFFGQVKKDLDDHPDDYLLARFEDLLGSWNAEITKNYELAFEHWYKALDVYRRLPDPVLDIRLCLQKVYDYHYHFGNYREAIAALKEALAVNLPQYDYILRQIPNTLGLCYQQLNQLDSADYYFKITYHNADSLKNDDWKAIASGNLGNDLFLRNKYQEAIPLLQYDVDMSVKRADWPCASGSQTILADIALRQSNLSAAWVQLSKARQYVYLSGQYRRLKPLYPLLSRYYTEAGNAKLAMMYLDSSAFVNDSLARVFSAMQLLKASQKADLAKRNAEIAEIENQKRIKILERNGLIAFVIIILFVSLYIYSQQRKKNLQKQQLLNLQLKEKEAELHLAAMQLENFAGSISEKNKLLEILQLQLGEGSDNQALLQLQQSTILTDREWEKFRATFEKVHGGYLNRLRQKLPGLSPAETRYMTLAKLKLTNKEMAATLGVGAQAIRVTTFRLRKKLHMAEYGSLEELVASI